MTIDYSGKSMKYQQEKDFLEYSLLLDLNDDGWIANFPELSSMGEDKSVDEMQLVNLALKRCFSICTPYVEDISKYGFASSEESRTLYTKHLGQHCLVSALRTSKHLLLQGVNTTANKILTSLGPYGF